MVNMDQNNMETVPDNAQDDDKELNGNGMDRHSDLLNSIDIQDEKIDVNNIIINNKDSTLSAKDDLVNGKTDDNTDLAMDIAKSIMITENPTENGHTLESEIEDISAPLPQSITRVPASEIQPINDDDDIVLVDLEASKDNEDKSNDKSATEESVQKSQNNETSNSDNSNNAKTSAPEPPPPKKLVEQPLKFMAEFKEALGEMSRDDLEEFCLLKFAEAIDSKCNLSKLMSDLNDHKAKLEEWRKKVIALTKQNKDLQIVVKTISDEINKKIDDIPIPIKITRSVGLQVGMPCVTKKNSEKRDNWESRHSDRSKSKNKSTNNAGNVQTTRKQPNSTVDNPHNQPATSSGLPTTPSGQPATISGQPMTPSGQPITPVNRGINMQNNSEQNSTNKQLHKPTIQSSAEKRSQQTIDLTDDDPPSKQVKLNNKTAPKSPALRHFIRPVGPQQVLIPINPQNQRTINPPALLIQQPKNIVNNRPPVPIVRRPGPASRMAAYNIRPVRSLTHPAPLPLGPRNQLHQEGWKHIPPRPSLKIMKVDQGIVISWEMGDFNPSIHEEVASYQIFAYQQTSTAPNSELWKKIGDVKALPLPMACTLTHFLNGFKYFFAIRALDVKSRLGPFSFPEEILLF